jgi:general secretion pathway protein E
MNSLIIKTENNNITQVDLSLNNNEELVRFFIKYDIFYCLLGEEYVFACSESNFIQSLSILNKNSEKVNNKRLIVANQHFLENINKSYFANKYNNDVVFEDEEKDLENIQNILDTNFDLLSDKEDSAPTVKLLNSVIFNAIKLGSSDIHIETNENDGVIRFRNNGILEDFLAIDKRIISNLSNRIKFLSLLNSSEKKKAQDGQMTANILNDNIDIRISIIPTYYGERIVMRILMNSSNIKNVEELGFDKDTMNKLNSITSKSYGIFIVAGPTGSGKTTTLHSFLKEKSNPTINIMTVEDPIEYKTDYANQIQVSKNEDFGFNNALRAVLRQDPDVLMIGEVRDTITAKLAIEAALTGHYVMTSIHANDSISCISRLTEIQIEKYLIQDAVLGILSQRLVRINCNCKKEHSNGCDNCNFTGYTHREIIYELLVIDNHIREGIDNFSHAKILKIAKETQNFVSMKEQLDLLLKEGKIDKAEYERNGL